MTRPVGKVILVCMPWASANQPSLPLGLLVARLRKAGLPARCFYANLLFAEAIGLRDYENYTHSHNILCEWLFAEDLFGRFEPRIGPGEPASFLELLRQSGFGVAEVARAALLKTLVAPFLDRCLEAEDWSAVSVVGFTTTLVQTLPSLALARRLKSRWRHLKIIFGGAACQAGMGLTLMRNFPFIDALVDGEADETVAPLMASLMAGTQPPDLPGVVARNSDGSLRASAPAALDMARYLPPDHGDYFEQAAARRFAAELVVALPFEASRGCWWTTRHTCRFCGLNGLHKGQRLRPLAEVADEVAQAQARYAPSRLVCVDNILAARHARDLPEEWRQRGIVTPAFAELRVDMPRRQLAGLARAGVSFVQPGVESLSDEVLELTSKGTSVVQNICFLRRAKELGIHAAWNHLYGLPGERRAWYERVLAALPALFHLPPPDAVRYSLQRFSPFFREAEQWGIRVKGPMPGYRYLWDLPDDEIMELSFDLDFEYDSSRDAAELSESLGAACAAWRASGAVFSADLDAHGHVLLTDTRPLAASPEHLVPRPWSTLLRCLEAPSTVAQAAECLRQAHAADYIALGGEAGVDAALRDFAARRWCHAESGRFVGLFVPSRPGFWTSLDEASSIPDIR